jgi:hypothetical protein
MMIGKHKFIVGQRVRPSADGIDANIFRPRHHDASGRVVRVDQFNVPTVLWDYRKTAAQYHPDFIEPDRRRKPVSTRTAGGEDAQ